MMREAFLLLSRQSWLRHWMENSTLSQKLTSRFVAGPTLEDALKVVSKLGSEKTLATLDHLGENVSSLEEAARSRDNYLEALEQIDSRGLQATISIKLTQLGLDFSEEACRNNLVRLVERARTMGGRVEVDMESSEYTGRTLNMVTEVGERYRNWSGTDSSLRAVIQAYLYRSERDIEMLCEKKIPVRICKGAYREPASVAFTRMRDVDQNYVKLMKLLFQKGTYPAIASHDDQIVSEVLRYASEQKLSSDRFEFQMLYGIRRDLQRRLIGQGFRLRLYVPYGNAWYPYFMRRLAERPANVLFLAKNLLRS